MKNMILFSEPLSFGSSCAVDISPDRRSIMVNKG
jgi:hypothetical protein